MTEVEDLVEDAEDMISKAIRRWKLTFERRLKRLGQLRLEPPTH